MVPKKYPQNLHTPKNIYFSEKPQKILKFKTLTPKKWSEPTYVWKYPRTPPFPPGVPRRYFFCGSFMFFLSCVCYAFLRVCLFVPCCHLLGKGWPLGSRSWCITVSLLLSHWYPGPGVVLDSIDSWSLHRYLLRIATMYDFAVEDCLYHPTCKKCFYRHFGKYRELEDVSPHKWGLQKNFIHRKHYGSVTLIFFLLWGSIWVITRQSNLKYQGNYSLFHNWIHVNCFEIFPWNQPEK